MLNSKKKPQVIGEIALPRTAEKLLFLFSFLKGCVLCSMVKNFFYKIPQKYANGHIIGHTRSGGNRVNAFLKRMIFLSTKNLHISI